MEMNRMFTRIRFAFSICTFALALLGAMSPPLTAAESLSEIAAANERSLSQIENLQLKYRVQSEFREKNGTSRPMAKPQENFYAYSRTSRQKRLRINPAPGQQRVVDRYLANGLMREQSYDLAFDAELESLLPYDQKSYRAEISPAKPGLMEELVPQTLEKIPVMVVAQSLTLSELVQQWDCKLTKDDGVAVQIRADLPTRSAGKHAGSCLLVTVRRDKGYMIESLRIVVTGAGTNVETGKPATMLATFKVLKWQELAEGLWYPQQVRFGNHGEMATSSDNAGLFVDWTITSAVVNAEHLDKELGFAFLPNAVVVEYRKDGEPGRLWLWGPEGKAVTTFANADEYESARPGTQLQRR